jgi:hypothetical protein
LCAKITKNEIKVEKERLIGLIDKFKEDEIKAQNEAIAAYAYDSLLGEINGENNKNVDYAVRINELDWVNLFGSRTQIALNRA